MIEPVWLKAELVIAIHDEQLREFGGPPGIRDRSMLESALGRPQNKWSYGETDLAALAQVGSELFERLANRPTLN